MPSWKKILQSGSAVHVLNITASSLPNSFQPNIIGYNTASGRFTFFSTSSLVSGGSIIGGSGTTNYITRWSSSTLITTSSIYESGSRIGIGTGAVLPNAVLHISGANNIGLFEIDSVANNNILFVSGSGRVGIGTGTPNATLQIAGTLNNGLDSAPSGAYSHTEGRETSVSGAFSHAEGIYTSVLAPHSHAEGYGARVELIAGEGAAHAEGLATIASGSFQHVQGQHNRATQKQSAFIIGNGSTGNTNARKNLVEVNPTDGISDFFGPVRITRTTETFTQDPDKLRNENKAGIIYMGFTDLFNTPNRGPSPPIAVKVNNTTTGGTNYGTLKHPKPSAGVVSYYTKISHTNTNAVGASIQSANASSPYDVINTGIFTDGAVTAQEFRALGSSQISSTSDIRLKENIKDVDINTALKLIENVKPVTFNWKRPVVGDNSDTINGKFDVGVIAQDVLKNGFEHLVRIAENTLVPEHIDDEGYVSKEGYEFGVSYVGMIPYHAKVIKYLLDEIRELKSQIKALEEK